MNTLFKSRLSSFLRRNLCLVSCSFILVTFLGLTFGKLFATASAVALFVILVILLAFIRRIHFHTVNKLLPIVIFSLLAAILVRFVSLPTVDAAKQLDGKYVQAEGTVISVSSSETYKIITVKCESLNDSERVLNVAVILQKEYYENVDVGSHVKFGGEVEFDFSMKSKGNECFLSTFPSYCEQDGDSGFFWNFVYKLRTNVKKATTDMKYSGMINALLVGDKSGLDSKTKENFKKLGTSHVLAISGLHLSIVVMTFYTLVSKLALPHWCSASVSSVLSFVYMMMTGFSLSLVRAAQMLCVFFFARTARRKRDSVTSLFFAGLFIVFLNQWSLFNLGFLLSFVSTFGIIVFASPITQEYWRHYQDGKERGRIYSRRYRTLYFLASGPISSAATTLAASVCTVPLILVTFNEISFVAVIGNLCVLPFAKYFLIFSFVAVMLKGIFAGFLSLPFELLSGVFGFLFKNVTDLLGGIMPDVFSAKTVYLPFAVICVMALIVFFFMFVQRKLALALLSVSTTVFLLSFNLLSDIVIYPTAVVDVAVESGCNTSLVRWRGEIYLLDQTGTGSKRMGNIDDVISRNDISDITNAVFIASNKESFERLSAFLTILNPEKVTVLTKPSVNTADISRLCLKKGIKLDIKYTGTLKVADGITATNKDGSYSAFTVSNGDNSLCVLRGYSESAFLNYGFSPDILIGNGKLNGIYKSRLSPGGHYRIKE